MMKKSIGVLAALALATAVSMVSTLYAATPAAPGAGAAPGGPPVNAPANGAGARRGGRRGGGGPGGGGGVPAGRGAADAVPQVGNNTPIAHEHLLTKAKLGAGKIDLYMQGDSIMRRWGCSDPSWSQNLANWNENFHGWNAGDFGWGADLIQNILWRMKNGELDGVNPKAIVFLGGTNNVGGGAASDEKIADITKGLQACLDVMKEKAPNATIVMIGILPRGVGSQASINKINENIAKMADGKKVRYLNVNDKLADKDGKVNEGLFVDGLHPTPKGYQIIADGLKPILTEVLGPRGKEDHAPPPTGDPKVAPDYPPKPK